MSLLTKKLVDLQVVYSPESILICAKSFLDSDTDSNLSLEIQLQSSNCVSGKKAPIEYY